MGDFPVVVAGHNPGSERVTGKVSAAEAEVVVAYVLSLRYARGLLPGAR